VTADPPTPWTYRARLVRVVDADTIHVELDLGFDVVKREVLRLAKLDSPELSTPEGRVARAVALDWLSDAKTVEWPLLITTRKADRYKRYIATVTDATTSRPSLNDYLLEHGYAQPWPSPA
jgi:micrococcal nuclease